MDGNVILLFYSKYSPNCMELLNKIRDVLDFRKICIDNKEIRDTVLCENSKYQVKVVPTIFVFFANGIMKKYEGSVAFSWCLEVCNNIQKKMTSLPEKTLIVSEESPKTKILNLDTKSIENLGMKRKIETSPLIPPKEIAEESRMDGNRNDKKVLDKKNDIKSLAQQLQAQREIEDEMLNPNAVSKLTSIASN